MLLYTCLAYLEGPEHKKKTLKFIKQKPKKRRDKIQGCRGQNHAGEVSKFKFRSLSLICAFLHLSSISGRSSKQKNSKFIEGRSQKCCATKKQGCRGQNHAGEVSKFKFRYLSLIWALLHLSSISGRSSTQKNSKFIEGRRKKSGATKYRVGEVRMVQERFLNSSLGLCLWFELFYTFLASVEGPQNKKTRNLLKAEEKKAAQQITGL